MSSLLIYHLAQAAPDPSWRCAILFEQPHVIDPDDHDPIAIELVDAYADADPPDACATQPRSSVPLQSSEQLRGVVAWMLYMSQQPHWARSHTWTFELISKGQSRRPRVGFEAGCIVSAKAGEDRTEEAARVCLAMESGALWFHVDPIDEPAFVAGFEELAG